MTISKTKKREFPNTYVIVFAIIIISAIATWFVSGGEYVPDERGGVEFVEVDSTPQTWQIFTALFNGFSKQAGIIVFILIIGGAFWIINASKAIDAGIYSFLRSVVKLEKYGILRKIGVNNIVMTLIMVLFSVFGAVFGMSEETIAFTIILVPLAISMGYDSITGVALVYIAAHVGFAGAFLNPFTIGIAQSLANVPMFSGIEYRFFCWIVLTLFMITFVLIYANRVKKRPESSIMYEEDAYWRANTGGDKEAIIYYKNTSSWVAFALSLAAIIIFTVRYMAGCTVSLGNNSYSVPWLMPVAALLYVIFSVISLRKSVHFFIFNMLIFTIVYLIIGVLGFSWYISEISALFLVLGLLSGIAAGFKSNKLANEFMAGAKDILSAAVIVGLAAGIIEILRDGKIIDTILHSMAGGLGESGKYGSLSLMYAIQTAINMIIPSASAKAAITMPIMAPFADIIGLSRQATVLAFQFGDGFTNMITPASGVLIAVLGIARIPYTKWFKWVWKFILILIALGFLLLIPTILLGLPGF